jgi:protein ImuB
MAPERRILSVYLPNFQEELQTRTGKEGEVTSTRRHLIHLAQWAYRFSPIVATDRIPKELPTDDPRFCGFAIDISGCEKLFQGEAAIAGKLSTALTQFKLTHRIAIAPSVGAAWGLSRYGAEDLCIVKKQAIRELVIKLSIHSLRLPKKTEALLAAVKISTIEELVKIPRPSLLERFGKEILDRIDQLFGIQHEPLYPVKIQTLSRVEREFDGAVCEMDTIKGILWEMLGDLLQKLKRLQQQPSQLTLQLKCVSRELISKQVGLSLPSYNHRHLFRMFEERLSTTQVPSGVEKITVIASRTEEYEPEPMQFLAIRSTDATGEKQLGELLDTLVTNLGERSVLVPTAQANPLPEETLVLKLARELTTNDSRHSLRPQSLPRTDRPSLLLNKPQPIRAMATLPDGPPFWLKWREKTYEVTKAIGPERVTPEWWKERQIEPRDYFKIQIPTGAWLWVYREIKNSQWFLQGLWT